MIYREHYIELFVNGNQVELEAQKSLNMRLNNVLFDPTKVSSSQGEYSFEFEIPMSKHNNIIFDYANELSKVNKFNKRWNAEVYADGHLIFDGSLTINGFKEGKYNVNLVSVKVYSLEDIFGDAVMTDINNWNITFNGISTINSINNSRPPAGANPTEVLFPLVSYGVFQKVPKVIDEVANEYTPKFDLDEYNRWWVESFYPSHNMCETLRHAFEYKGYEVNGDIFQDMFLKNVYMSINLADGQVPDYNVGNPSFGAVDISTSYTIQTGTTSYEQDLGFPYFRVQTRWKGDGTEPEEEFNFRAVKVYSLLSSGATVTSHQSPCYMYQPNEECMVIPVDGWYKIEMTVNSKLNTTSPLTVAQYIKDNSGEEMEEQDISINPNLSEFTPIEIQLVRNYDDNIELIKGKDNVVYKNGNPNDETYGRYDNKEEWLTCYPHEDPYNAARPTKDNDLVFRNTTSNLGGKRKISGNDVKSTEETEVNNSGTDNTSNQSGNDITSESGNFSGYRGNTSGRGGTRGTNTIGTGTLSLDGGGRVWSPSNFGYVYADNEIHCYDQAVSEGFICGFSSMGNKGAVSVMKNGYSWSKSCSIKNEVFAPVIGYWNIYREGGDSSAITSASSMVNDNSYINTPVSRITTTNTGMTGYLSCMVYLNKNDVLQLFEVHREYHTEGLADVSYSTTTNVDLKITAFSKKTQNMLIAKHENRYEAEVQFPEKLNLANFFNKEKRISDWVQSVVDAFNLEVIQNNKTVTINKKKKLYTRVPIAVDIDDRVNSADAEASMIEYPKSMSVKYKIDTDEWGAENSAIDNAGGDDSIMNTDDWKKYIDSGYSVVTLNTDLYATSTSDVELQFAYTWYDNFNWYAVNSSDERTSNDPVTLSLPVISKYSYMIEGYSYEESMKHDGYSLVQRFWFRPWMTNQYVWTDTYPAEKALICIPQRIIRVGDLYLNMNYKDDDKSLLTEYFNIIPYLASNYIEVDVYLSPDEYNRIKGGSPVHFDSDVYLPVEISGYDASGYNPTTLKLMKKL